MNSHSPNIPPELPWWLRLPIDQLGLVLGPLVMLVWLKLPAPQMLTPEAHRFAGIFLLTVIWWVTEPIPIAATGLLAVVLAAFIGAVPDTWKTDRIPDLLLAKFANPSVFFLIGSLFIGCAMSRHGLDRRVAISILSSRWAGRSPATILLGVGMATMLVSMWVSNVAATAMIYPVTLGIIDVLSRSGGGPEFSRGKYASALLLMNGYASTVGGIATPIGTSTNILAIGLFEGRDYFGRSVDFTRWCMIGVPMTALIMLALFLWLRWGTRTTNLDLTQLRAYLQAERQKLGRWNRGEINTLIVFLTVVGLWVAPSIIGSFGSDADRDWLDRHFPESVVSILAPVLLYLLPVDWKNRRFTLEPGDFSKIDWSTMLLFGAGITLGNLMVETKLAQAIGQAGFAAIGTTDVWIITAAAIVAAILFSEFSSNSATAATLIPIVFALCKASNVDALPPLLGVAFGASFGSALPVSTPPNAIVYGSGLLPVRRMITAGTGLDIAAGLVIFLLLRAAFALGWSPFAT